MKYLTTNVYARPEDILVSNIFLFEGKYYYRIRGKYIILE